MAVFVRSASVTNNPAMPLSQLVSVSQMLVQEHCLPYSTMDISTNQISTRGIFDKHDSSHSIEEQRIQRDR